MNIKLTSKDLDVLMPLCKQLNRSPAKVIQALLHNQNEQDIINLVSMLENTNHEKDN